MTYNLLAADTSQIIMIAIVAVVIILMVVLTIIPQRKRKKEQEQMMNSLTIGTKLMTVGGLVGRITQVNADNTLIINVGTESTPTLIVIDKKAVGYVLENVNAPAPAPATTPVVETPAIPEVPVANETAATENTEKVEEHDHIENIYNEEGALPEEKSSLADLDKPF